MTLCRVPGAKRHRVLSNHMRRTAVIALVALAAIGQADRLITIPTARKIPFETVRYEFRAEPTSDGQTENLLGFGITNSFDGELRTFQDRHGKAITTGDLAYNYISPIAGFTPGFSAGFQDVANQTATGRRFFVATTFRQQLTTLDGDYPADITIGFFGAKRSYAFVGVQIPFSKDFHFLAEHDGTRIATGFEYKANSLINLRAQFIGARTVLSLQATKHF